ncbi:NUMOD4 domain-containing protein [Achromobacter sp. GD03932]|uniref:NUMOD4 domain-containing protein n=1 Tax=Achromobacter sp. GD03932 TaxID=2975407 RepID=UPI00244AB11D|nr:NUMOD4 domain-containing protein [Achromobacter sp. GD03932]MDH1299714.1 NUMOD4 domain-containing protein [Achromobacter sp. GD03932]
MTARKPPCIAVPDVPVRPVPGYEGLYSVSADGRVWSEPREMPHAYSRAIQVGGKWLAPGWNRTGYRTVQLFRSCRYETKVIHRLVALAWIPKQEGDGNWVNHKNGIKHDNHVDNLEWSTPSQNNAHAYRTGLRVAPKRRFTDEQARAIRERIANGEQQRAIAREFGVVDSAISQLRNRKTYTHVQ